MMLLIYLMVVSLLELTLTAHPPPPASTLDQVVGELPVPACSLLPNMDLTNCDPGRDDDDKDEGDDNDLADDDDKTVTAGTRCLLDTVDGEVTVMTCTEGGWSGTRESLVSATQLQDTKMRVRKEVNDLRFVVSLIMTVTSKKRCFLLCKTENGSPRIKCPDIPEEVYTDQGTNSATLTWEQPSAIDPEDGPLRAWRSSGVGSGLPLTEGNYQVSFMTKDSRGKTDTCTKNFRIKAHRCPSSHTYLTNGEASCSSYTLYGSECRYSCHSGYELSGHPSAVCQNNETWSNPMPTCKEVSCGPPPTNNNIKVLCAHYLYGATCGVSCMRAGYAVLGSSTITCQADRMWTSPGQCVDILPPSVPCNKSLPAFIGSEGAKASVDWTLPSAEDNSGQDVEVTCDPQPGATFDLGAHKVTFSGKDAAGNKAKCFMTVDVQVIKCDAIVTSLDFADVSCTHGNLFGSVCTVSCYHGYQLVGDASVTCQEDGKWSGRPPQCHSRSCPAPPTISHGNYLCPDGHEIQDSCTLACNIGYRSVAPLTITCTSDMMWSLAGSCLDVQPPVFPDGCPADMVISAARLGDVTYVIYDLPQVTDNSGETVIVEGDPKPGAEVAVGQTSVSVYARDSQGNTASCQFYVLVRNTSCDQPDLESKNDLLHYACPNNYVHGAFCKLSCPNGYPLQGPTTITCEKVKDTGRLSWTWTGDVTPHCKAEICPELPAPGNGAIRCTKFKGNRGVSCLVSCQEGYMFPMSVPESYNCFQETAKWNNGGHVPDCIERRKAERVMARPAFYYEGSSCPSINNTDFKQKFQQALSGSMYTLVCSTCNVTEVDITCDDSRRKKRATGTNKAQLQVYVGIDLGPYEDKGDSEETTAFYDSLLNQMNSYLFMESDSGLFNIPGAGRFDTYKYAATEYGCPSGTRFTPKTMACAGCGEGHMYDNSTRFCFPCPKATYQEQEIAFSCLPCPSGTTTRELRSTTIQQCLALCSPGTVSASGIEPCHPCPRGSYQSQLGKTSCDLCPFGMSTIQESSLYVSDCQFYDVRMSENTPKPRIDVISSDLPNPTLSMWVHPVSSTYRTLLTFALDRDSAQRDLAFFSLGHQQIFVSSQNPGRNEHVKQWYHVALVYNNGSARLYVDGKMAGEAADSLLTDFRNKTVSFTGSETIKSITVSGLQVTNSSLTEDQIQEFSSTCDKRMDTNILIIDQLDVSLTTLSTCDDVDECVGSPCGQHGLCVDGVGNFTCVCDQIWSGETCDTVSDFCIGHDCANGASCVSSPDTGTYSCTCAAGYRGRLCLETVVNGGWGDWTGWGACSVTCGVGRRSRSRECDNPRPDPEGEGCHGDWTEEQVCTGEVCPVDGGWGKWTAWDCNATCGVGMAIRSRQCDNPAPRDGGLTCIGPRHAHKECEVTICSVDGKFGQWSDWSQCTVTCGGGVSTRKRLCDSPAPSQGGAECDANQAVESKLCNNHACPKCKELIQKDDHQTVNCVQDDENAMTICNITCDQGFTLIPEDVTEVQCGRLTKYTWSHQIESNPNGRLPACTPMKIPSSQKTKMNIKYDNIDCNNPSSAEEIKDGIKRNVETTVSCAKSGDCSSSVQTKSTCDKRKRSTGTIIAIISMDVNQGSPMTPDRIYLMEEMALQLMGQAKEIFKVKVGGMELNGEVKSAEVEIVCQDGSGLMDGACVDCPAGTYSTGDGSCEPCERGFYQNQTRSTSCIPCPDGLTTAGAGSPSEADCEADPPDYMDLFAWTYASSDYYDTEDDDDGASTTVVDDDEDNDYKLTLIVVGAATAFLALLITGTTYSIIRAGKKTTQKHQEDEEYKERTYINKAYMSSLQHEMAGKKKEEDPYHTYEEIPAPELGSLVDEWKKTY